MNMLTLNRLLATMVLSLPFIIKADVKAMDPQFELSPQLVLNAKGKDTKEKAPAATSAKKHVSSARQHVKRQKSQPAKYAKELLSPSTEQVSKPSSYIADDTVKVGLLPAWENLVSSSTAEIPAGPLSFQSESFSLTLDPSRYPMLPGQDGSTILLDPKGTLPPLVRMLIQEKGRTLRVVGSPQQDQKKFLGELLEASGFYSVEEKPLLEFGSDPRLTVRADFKVEKNAESLVKNDIVLVNAAKSPSSPHLTSFLKKEGVSVLEPFVQGKALSSTPKHLLLSISPKDQPEMLDTLLSAISVKFEKNRRVELFSVSESGFGLSVQTDRYFDRNGQKYVITRFTGDPVAYTLLRLLETKGYKVVILEGKDGFRSISEKLFSKMDIAVSYAPQLLISDPDGRYSLELSGVLLENASSNGGKIVLTDRKVEADMRAVLSDYGYQIEER